MRFDLLLRSMRHVAAALVLAGLAAAPAGAFDTQAEAAYVVDYNTGTVLLEKNAHEPLPPSSMSKLMTLYMLFEALRDIDSLTLETRFPVSDRAAAMGGSSMFLNTSDRPTVEELIRGIVVQSGNDATVVVAEGLSGSEEAFAQLMNDRAQMLGMTESTFVNSSGWPHPGHRMSMRDLGILTVRLISDFPEFYEYFAEEKFEFDGRVPSNHFNRNPLLGLDIGADGLKTGHTQEAGFGLVGSAQQGGRRVVFVVNGVSSREARAAESQRILNWAFRQFVEREVMTEGRQVAEAPVWMGAAESVGLVAAEGRTMLLPVLAQNTVPGEVIFNAPIAAPIAAGDVLGELILRPEGLPEARVPLLADRAVPEGGFSQRVTTVGRMLLEQLGDRAGGAL